MVSDETIRNIFQNEFALWSSVRERYRAKDTDLEELLLSWAVDQIARLESPGAQDDFLELCNDGCVLQVLAAILSLLRSSPSLELFWSELIGQPVWRQKAVRRIEKAAGVVESLFAAAGAEISEEHFNVLGRIPPFRVAAELRFYSRVIKSAEKLKADTRAHSLTEVAKYLLSSYTDRITQRPHDRNISALIASVTSKSDYGEVDHRMWRSRNYERLDQQFSWVTRILVVASIVLVFSE